MRPEKGRGDSVPYGMKLRERRRTEDPSKLLHLSSIS